MSKCKDVFPKICPGPYKTSKGCNVCTGRGDNQLRLEQLGCTGNELREMCKEIPCPGHPGWTGNDCEKDPCYEYRVNNTCNHGVCEYDKSTGLNVRCKCDPMATSTDPSNGKWCDDLCWTMSPSGEKVPQTCSGHGTCSPSTGQCSCDPGYYGPHCEQDACVHVGAAKFCNDNGVCHVSSSNTPTCKCDRDWTGQFCDRHCNEDYYWDGRAGVRKCVPCKYKHENKDIKTYCPGTGTKDTSSVYPQYMYCDQHKCSENIDNVHCSLSCCVGCPDKYKPGGTRSDGRKWNSSDGYDPGNPCYWGTDMRLCEYSPPGAKPPVMFCDDHDCSEYIHDVSCSWGTSDIKDCPDGYNNSGTDTSGFKWSSSTDYPPGNPCYWGSDLRRCEIAS